MAVRRYYGHHEAEWGMAWCASLGPAFWEGYRELIPKAPGFNERYAPPRFAPLRPRSTGLSLVSGRPESRLRYVLYELYHKLNHYNLFGGGYASDSIGLMMQLSDERRK